LARACAVARVRLPGLLMRGSGYPEEFLHAQAKDKARTSPNTAGESDQHRSQG
jgi:hypothetical protein